MRSLPILLLLAACGGPSYTGTAPDDTQGDVSTVAMGSGPDDDGDGYGATLDCDDADDDINPGANEDPANGIDDDCDGAVDCEDDDADLTDSCYDADGDGWCQDLDGDGVIEIVFLCNPEDDANAAIIAEQTGGDPALVTNYIEVAYGEFPDYDVPDPDCDDGDSGISPGADEVCDDSDTDEDCDGYANELDPDDSVSASSTWYADADLDGYGDAEVSAEACEQPEDYVADSTDCDDDHAGVNPGATEACDAEDVDEDCDGAADDADEGGATGTSSWYDDIDGDGVGAGSATMSCDALEGQVSTSDDCDDGDAWNFPGNDELCDGADNDCDGAADNDPVDETTWFADADADGYGDESTTYVSCSSPTGWTATGGDCDDGETSVNPAASETYNGVDDDCDGSVDNGATCSVEIQILADGGEASSLTLAVSDDATLSGEAYPSGVTGVTVIPTSLGGSDWEYLIDFDVCVSASGSVILDGWFASGESLGDDPVANVFADMDGVELSVATYSNSDGTYAYEITR